MTLSDSKFLGSWRIDNWNANSPGVTMSLTERKEDLETPVPSNFFSFDDFPSMDIDLDGKVIPCGIGTVLGATAFLINSTLKQFKVVDHSVLSFDGFFDENRNTFTPDTINLSTGEFTYLAWDGEADLFADFTADGENPSDAIGILLTDTVRGASIPLDRLDTTSIGKGFGANGARADYVYGLESPGGDEAVEFPIGLYIDKSEAVEKWVQRVSAAAFAILYVDGAGLYQIKAWNPIPSEGLLEITDNEMTGVPTLQTNSAQPKTKAIARYGVQHGFDGSSIATYESDELRQLRGLSAHTILDEEVPISSRFGAKLWAEKTVYSRGRPRRSFRTNATQQYMELEPGDFLRVNSARKNVNEVFEVLEITTEPGSLNVYLNLTDIRGWRDKVGFWTSDAPAFPASLGGAAVTVWDASWTEGQKQWARENLGFWHDDDGYADVSTDPLESNEVMRWF